MPGGRVIQPVFRGQAQQGLNHIIPRQPPPDPLKDPLAYFQWSVDDAKRQMHNWGEPVRDMSGSLQPTGVPTNRGGLLGGVARWMNDYQQKNKKK
jgi:hypothetical protein